MRNEDGFCIECDPDEPGEVIGKILKDASKPGARFEGYATNQETEKKILHDVFDKGDIWFRTGDLMRKDAERLLLLRRPHRRHLPLEGRERVHHRSGGGDRRIRRSACERTSTGCACPAATAAPAWRRSSPNGPSTWPPFATISTQQLPDYARPVFLRLRSDIEMTSTFKTKKIDLVQEGFDPRAINDPIYVNDPAAKAFVRIDAALYDRIISGQVRL